MHAYAALPLHQVSACGDTYGDTEGDIDTVEGPPLSARGDTGSVRSVQMPQTSGHRHSLRGIESEATDDESSTPSAAAPRRRFAIVGVLAASGLVLLCKGALSPQAPSGLRGAETAKLQHDGELLKLGSTGPEAWSHAAENVWSDAECPNLGAFSMGVHRCQDRCKQTSKCTAINFNNADNTCILRACIRLLGFVVAPMQHIEGWHGYSLQAPVANAVSNTVIKMKDYLKNPKPVGRAETRQEIEDASEGPHTLRSDVAKIVHKIRQNPTVKKMEAGFKAAFITPSNVVPIPIGSGTVPGPAPPPQPTAAPAVAPPPSAKDLQAEAAAKAQEAVAAAKEAVAAAKEHGAHALVEAEMKLAEAKKATGANAKELQAKAEKAVAAARDHGAKAIVEAHKKLDEAKEHVATTTAPSTTTISISLQMYVDAPDSTTSSEVDAAMYKALARTFHVSRKEVGIGLTKQASKSDDSDKQGFSAVIEVCSAPHHADVEAAAKSTATKKKKDEVFADLENLVEADLVGATITLNSLKVYEGIGPGCPGATT